MRQRVAFLGLGAMGQRMALRVQQAGHSLVVWSRSGVPAAAVPLRDLAASSPRHAVESAEVVIAMVTDDEASRRVWEDPEAGALGGLRPGALVLESSTLSPAWVTRLAARVAAAGADFLEAPVVGSRPQAEAGALVYLLGGEGHAFARARPLLSAMGSALHHVGPTPHGALAKLIVNGLFSAQVAVMAELLGIARKAQLDTARLLEVMGALPVMSPAAKASAEGMLAGRFAPMFPLALASKDLRYLLEAAAAARGEMPVVTGIARELQAAAEGGLAEENLTAISKRYG